MEITQKPLHSSQRKHKKNEAAFSYNEKFKSKWIHEDTLDPRLFTYDGLWSLKSGRNQALYWKAETIPMCQQSGSNTNSHLPTWDREMNYYTLPPNMAAHYKAYIFGFLLTQGIIKGIKRENRPRLSWLEPVFRRYCCSFCLIFFTLLSVTQCQIYSVITLWDFYMTALNSFPSWSHCCTFTEPKVKKDFFTNISTTLNTASAEAASQTQQRSCLILLN